MATEKLQQLARSLSGLALFRALLERPLFFHFGAFAFSSCEEESLDAYGAFVNEIYDGGASLPAAVRKAVFENENEYIRRVAAKKPIPAAIEEALKKELAILSQFASLRREDFAAALKTPYVAPFESGTVDLSTEYAARVREVGRFGYGIFATAGMFRLTDGDEPEIEPIASPDEVTLDSFIGYEEERAEVLSNTAAFLSGRPAANVLLYGDAGTGKSSTVKAVLNRFYDEGLRLIEIRKDQLAKLPFVMGRVRGNPLRFIIFIDDLSFDRNDDCFSMLKAALEGSASAKAPNAVIYATSNRRHIVRECFGDRDGDEVHRNDTMQETLSLSERFGLTVLFAKPNKELYLRIVAELAAQHGVKMDPAELAIKAEAFALGRGSRSARCAEQFIDHLINSETAF